MTNSASEPGNEDVLASIRRLVAATPDRPSAANGTSSGAFSGGGAGDRLLLTPALRVAEPEAGGGAPVPPAPRGLTLEDRIAELEAAVGSQASEFEPDGSEVAHVGPPEELVRAVENLEIDSDGAGEAAEDAGDAPAGDGPSLPAAEHAPERRGLFLAASTSDPGAGTPDPRPEPASGDALTDLPAGLFFTRHDRAASVTPLETPLETPAPMAGPVTEPVPEPASEWSDADETAGVAAPDEDLSEESATVPEQGADEDDLVGAPEPWVEDEGVPEFRHAAVATASEGAVRDTDAVDEVRALDEAAIDEVDAAAVGAVAEMLLDEEKLREIVAELLRDELQGPLGEKITRNIRKLVRREIERALTVRDFD
jgi:hypothetical protein